MLRADCSCCSCCACCTCSKRRPATRGAEKSQAFDALFAATIRAGTGASVEYGLPYPKYEFLNHVVERERILLHDSNDASIVRLEPRRQTRVLGRPVEAVFATPDGIWPLFFAIVNRAGFRGSMRNNCLRVTEPDGAVRKFYWFSLSQPMLDRADAFCDGWIYLLPGDSFEPSDTADEWISRQPVEPLAKLPVSPSDFPFLHAIAGHRDDEPLWRFFGRMLLGGGLQGRGG